MIHAVDGFHEEWCNLYYIFVGDDLLILVLYVDDLFITGAERLISGSKEDLAMEFEMKDIGLMHYFLGLEVWHDGHIFLGQGQYVVDELSIFHMVDCRPMSTPMITNWKSFTLQILVWWIPHCIGKLLGP